MTSSVHANTIVIPQMSVHPLHDRAFRLPTLLAALFAGFGLWVGFLVWLALHYANLPAVNAAQLHQANWVVLGQVIEVDPAHAARYRVKIAEVLKRPGSDSNALIKASETVAINGPSGLTAKGSYFWPVNEGVAGQLGVVPAPYGGKKKDVPLQIDFGTGYVVAPSVEGFGTPLVYAESPRIREQISEVIHKRMAID